MRTGLNFLQAVIGLTTITVLVACGDDGGGAGGGGDGGGSATTNTSTNAGATTGNVTSTGTTPAGPGPSSVTTGGNDCTANVFENPDVNACGQENCCDEMLACEEDNFANCVNFDANPPFIDENTPAGGPLLACMEAADCFGPVTTFCGGGIGYGEDAPPEVIEFLECFNDGCCEAWAVCTDDGNDEDGCLSCLRGEIVDADGNPDYTNCLPAHLCAQETCEEGLLFFPYCDSGIGNGGTPEVPQCVSDNCCAEYNACTGGPYTDDELANPTDEQTAAIQACLDCLNEGGGALCDAAITCEEANCNTQICDSGLVIDNIELSACLSDACCAEFSACTGGDPEDEAAVQACIDCFNEYDPEGNDPPGALCASAIACQEANCEGGEGGGGGGGGGTGGAGGAGG